MYLVSKVYILAMSKWFRTVLYENTFLSMSKWFRILLYEDTFFSNEQMVPNCSL